MSISGDLTFVKGKIKQKYPLKRNAVQRIFTFYSFVGRG